MNIDRYPSQAAERQYNRPKVREISPDPSDAPHVDDMIRRYFRAIETEKVSERLRDLVKGF